VEAYIDRVSFGYADVTSDCMDLEHGLNSVVTAIFYRQ